MGWVTPLGSGVSAVWERLLQGESAVAEFITSPLHARSYPVFRVPTEATSQAPTHPRLRRSSAISRFAVVAGLAALEEANVELTEETAERTAIIFAISNGGVVYTKRFYHEVVQSGARAASPLLFPETVFNAPASHLAAILGITGASYTLVGDGAVGILALKMAEDLMLDPRIDRCLVVGAEETDWLLCDAYRRWHLLRDNPPLEIFDPRPRGTILSEGAGAILLARSGDVAIETIDAGCNFRRQSEAVDCVRAVFGRLNPTSSDVIIASANGTFIDDAETAAMLPYNSEAYIYAPKAALGESVGASSLWQVICGAQALREQQLPPLPVASAAASEKALAGNKIRAGRALISACGMNQQVAGLTLARAV